MRDVVFIGHATPEDNEFTLWLQAKLKNEGYNCECDLSFLIGGENDYWNSLQEMITDRAIKYILVLSKDTFKKSGVKDEWEHCRSLEKELGLTDFIIPVKIDDVPFNVRIGLNRRNIIPFNQWGSGLKRLLRKLETDNVPKSSPNSLSIKDWYENTYTTFSGVENNSEELFYSNWLKINELPPRLYLFQFETERQAKELLNYNTNYPVVRHGNFLVSFSKSLDTFIIPQKIEITPKFFKEIETTKVFEYYESDDFPKFQELKNLVVRLLKSAFDKHLRSLSMNIYEYANDNLCYFFTRINDEKAKGEFTLNGKKKSIGVHGHYKSLFWHFGVSFHPLLYPELCFSLKTHIVFTEDGVKPIENKRKQHSYRRDKGRMMYNKEWRDQLLAFSSKLVNDSNNDFFELRMSEENMIRVFTTPMTFDSSFGYIEPNDESRERPIEDLFDDNEYLDDLEKEYLDEN